MHIKQKIPYLRYGYFLLAIPVFFVIRYYYLNDPSVSQEGTVFAVCPLHYTTGIHCPGCGSQRAVHDLLHLRVWDSLQHNFLLPIVLIILIAKGYSILTKKYVPSYHYDLGGRPWFTYSLIIFIFGYWILRNIPYEPFTFLAP